MASGKLDLEIPQGSVFEFTVNVDGGPVSLVGYTGLMQIRASRSVDSVLLAEVDPGDIQVNDSTRQVTVMIPSDDTSGYDWTAGQYDLLLVGPEDWRICEGRVTVSKSITKEA